MGRSSRTGQVQSLARGLAVIEALFGCEDGLSLHELSERLKCPKPSLLRLLDTLLERGYLRFDEAGGRYALDPLSMLRAGNLYRPSGGRCVAIHRLLENLCQCTGETSVLGVIDPRTGMAAAVDYVEPPHVVRATPAIFQAVPALRMGLGRAWLAQLSDADAADAARRWAATSGAAIEEVADALGDLDVVRSLGHATVVDGLEEGLAAVAAVVTDSRQRAFGGAAVMAPAYRTSPQRLEAMGRAVRRTARMLSNLFAHDSVGADFATEPELVGNPS